MCLATLLAMLIYLRYSQSPIFYFQLTPRDFFPKLMLLIQSEKSNLHIVPQHYVLLKNENWNNSWPYCSSNSFSNIQSIPKSIKRKKLIYLSYSQSPIFYFQLTPRDFFPKLMLLIQSEKSNLHIVPQHYVLLKNENWNNSWPYCSSNSFSNIQSIPKSIKRKKQQSKRKKLLKQHQKYQNMQATFSVLTRLLW